MASLKDACFKLQESLESRSTIVLVCTCEIEYWGRSRSVVGEGDRVILIKPDSTLIIHSLSGFKPLNWMSSPTDTIAELVDSHLEIYSQRTVKPYEEMKIRVKKIHNLSSYSKLVDKSQQELTHTERDMEDFLVNNLHLVDPEFKLKKRQYRSPIGFFDLYGKIGVKTAVVELKVDRAGLPAALQLKRYRDWLTVHLKQDVDGMLIAPSFAPNALVLLRKEKLLYRKFSKRQIKHPDRNRRGTLEEWIND